jgi:hypothetical protein
MFRRIELIDEMDPEEHRKLMEALRRQKTGEPNSTLEKENPRFWKGGLMGYGYPAVTDAWAHLNSPRRAINENVRFYFTETGWRRYGCKAIEACQQAGQRYRVLRIKENAVDVVYRDEYQVAVRRKKKQVDRK